MYESNIGRYIMINHCFSQEQCALKETFLASPAFPVKKEAIYCTVVYINTSPQLVVVGCLLHVVKYI